MVMMDYDCGIINEKEDTQIVKELGNSQTSSLIAKKKKRKKERKKLKRGQHPCLEIGVWLNAWWYVHPKKGEHSLQNNTGENDFVAWEKFTIICQMKIAWRKLCAVPASLKHIHGKRRKVLDRYMCKYSWSCFWVVETHRYFNFPSFAHWRFLKFLQKMYCFIFRKSKVIAQNKKTWKKCLCRGWTYFWEGHSFSLPRSPPSSKLVGMVSPPARCS